MNSILLPGTGSIEILQNDSWISRKLDFEFIKLMGYVFCLKIVDGIITTKVFPSKFAIVLNSYKFCRNLTITYFIAKYGYIIFNKILLTAKLLRRDNG